VLILDTHVLLWWVNGDAGQLSAPARAAIEAERAAGEIGICAITAWEIAMLVKHGRLVLAMDVEAWLNLVASLVSLLPVDRKIAVKSVDLPGDFHKDPADRMIVATARHFGAALVTADEKIRDYPHLKTVW
jgi:PIN domain nuclease of toxin-antitoxin system